MDGQDNSEWLPDGEDDADSGDGNRVEAEGRQSPFPSEGVVLL